MDIIQQYNMAIAWIENNTIKDEGIAVNNQLKISYPEVSGYLIPTLIQWGHKELAIQYAKWLCGIQHNDGSWYSSDKSAPYVFDSAQILKGLLSISEIIPEVKANIIRGCRWIVSNILKNGRLTTPCTDAWGDQSICREVIHLYCLSPIKEAAHKYSISEFSEAADKVVLYYKENCLEDIINFNMLSHFYAYVIEGLVDMGEIQLAKQCMDKIALCQSRNGRIPAYKNVQWVCSTGVFQFAVVWYKLGELEKANKAFDYACSLQNTSGGWFGSYSNKGFTRINFKNNHPTYFSDREISWAVKYFLDALYLKSKVEFDCMSKIFSDEIDENDGRYKLLFELIKKIQAKVICDAGCGKGRYLKRLVKDIPGSQYYAMDISLKVMENIKEPVIARQGTLTNIPFADSTFDLIYSIEALEHAIDIKNALKEMVRVTKKSGFIVIIDKNKEKIGQLQLAYGEQWFDDKQMKEYAEKFICKLEIIKDIAYENKKDGLFTAWVFNKIL